MILISTVELNETMVCARDVRSRNDMLVIARGTRITRDAIRLLASLGVSEIYIEQPGAEAASPQESVPPELRAQCEAMLGRAMLGFKKSVETRRLMLSAEAAIEATSALFGEILERRQAVISLLDLHAWNSRLFQHSVNAAVLATELATPLGLSERERGDLALGMLFHDCGQMRLPREVFEKTEALTQQDWEMIRLHPRAGYEYLVERNMLSFAAMDVALHHHERIDGTGYPDGVQGEQLSPLARIAAVVEAFDSMTSLRAYGRAALSETALRIILAQTGKAYDKEVVMALMQYVAIYPPGTAVRLNTGEYGLVIGIVPGQVTRPRVRLYYGPQGRIRSVEVDLSRDTERAITASGASLEALRQSAA